MHPTLRGERVSLRRVVIEDTDALTAILAEPEVSRWWAGYDRERVIREFVEEDDGVFLTIEYGGEIVGAMDYWEEDDPEFRHAGIDIFLGPKASGLGLGPEAILVVIRYLVEVLGHHRVTIDPAAENARAIRAYEKVGFQAVGRMRQYELMPGGAWIDGLLMDVLADDLGLTPGRAAE